jgi:hypothetical protein
MMVKPGAVLVPDCAIGPRIRATRWLHPELQNQSKSVNIALQRCAMVYFGPLQSDNSDEGADAANLEGLSL